MAFLMASTAMARVLRPEWRLYSVSPTPTMQYLSLSPMSRPRRRPVNGLRALDLRWLMGGRSATGGPVGRLSVANPGSAGQGRHGSGGRLRPGRRALAVRAGENVAQELARV